VWPEAHNIIHIFIIASNKQQNNQQADPSKLKPAANGNHHHPHSSCASVTATAMRPSTIDHPANPIQSRVFSSYRIANEHSYADDKHYNRREDVVNFDFLPGATHTLSKPPSGTASILHGHVLTR
jgi:hypothetical protein